ncbi:ArpU family phage packaging/lysis transcriptional regulator [Holzapfeliella sp. JNUCC 80]
MIEELELIAGLDVYQTKVNTKKFLNSYKAFKTILSSKFEPKVTQTFSLELKSFGGSDNTSPIERHMIKQENAKEKLDMMFKALNSLETKYRVLLVLKYIDKRYTHDFEIMNHLGYADAQYYRLLTEALIHFAYAYNNGELVED